MNDQEFINAGFTVVGAEDNENKLLSFLKEHYPSVIKDNEINLNELKAIAGLPIDEKVNGYGLNFVGRNFARAKYAQKTEKELRLNTSLSKDIDTTKNLVLKGDNLDSLKILKHHYSSKIKCIYIDPPYNTTSDEFVYPDKFDKEEAEVLGLANLSESDFARMDFSFKTKKSHNGWLAFMYPRLLLARDILDKDGVIFISIDDNEQANLKLLCDDVFGEENFLGCIARTTGQTTGQDSGGLGSSFDYLLVYSKKENLELNGIELTEHDLKRFESEDEKGKYAYDQMRKTGSNDKRQDRPNMYYSIKDPDDIDLFPTGPGGYESCWRVEYKRYLKLVENNFILWKKTKKDGVEVWWPYIKYYLEGRTKRASPLWDDLEGNKKAARDLRALFDEKKVFDFTKPIDLIKRIVTITTGNNDIVLDFFAGSGTTGHAVMEINKDGGNRKYILCQIDEPIDPAKKKEAFDFCVNNNLEPVISSITIERLKRAGEKITKDIDAENSKTGMFEEDKKQIPDVGFKVFDSVEAPKLIVDETTKQISISENVIDAISRIYNMIFTVGLDEPTQVPEVVIENCIYKIGSHFYITNCDKINSDDYSNAIKNGKVFIDGWTASLNGTMQNYKEEVKIVF